MCEKKVTNEGHHLQVHSLSNFSFRFCRVKKLAWHLRLSLLERNRIGGQMDRRKSMIAAIILSGAVGLVSTPAWSQEAPGETRQPDPNLTRPGDGEEDIPGVYHRGTPELSKNDMKAVEEALKVKGYHVGRVDGVADDDARKAIRSFQRDSGLPITGMIDQRTAEKLDVTTSQSGSLQRNHSSSGMSHQSE